MELKYNKDYNLRVASAESIHLFFFYFRSRSKLTVRGHSMNMTVEGASHEEQTVKVQCRLFTMMMVHLCR